MSLLSETQTNLGHIEEHLEVARRFPLVTAMIWPCGFGSEQLAQELRDLFPAAIIEREGLLKIAAYGVGAENRLIVEVLGALKLWVNERGMAPVLVQFGDKTSFLEADA
jgi:hypothetical protein